MLDKLQCRTAASRDMRDHLFVGMVCDRCDRIASSDKRIGAAECDGIHHRVVALAEGRDFVDAHRADPQDKSCLTDDITIPPGAGWSDIHAHHIVRDAIVWDDKAICIWSDISCDHEIGGEDK